MAQVAETMHKDSCMCSKSELDLFSVPPTQVVMEKGFWEDVDPITSISSSDTIEFLCAANSGVYTDLASSYLYVKANITTAVGGILGADIQVGPSNLWMLALFSQVEVILNNKLVTPSSTAYPYRQCRINHMAEAAYATGPALLGAPRLLSSISPRIFCSLFQRGAQTVCQCGAPKSPSPPENARPEIKFKKRGTRKRGPKRFFVPCFSVSAGVPKGPRSPKTSGPKI
jgi:hypothetical protein